MLLSTRRCEGRILTNKHRGGVAADVRRMDGFTSTRPRNPFSLEHVLEGELVVDGFRDEVFEDILHQTVEHGRVCAHVQDRGIHASHQHIDEQTIHLHSNHGRILLAVEAYATLS